jgi:hypothetical protein
MMVQHDIVQQQKIKNKKIRFQNQLMTIIKDAFSGYPKEILNSLYNIPKHCYNPIGRFGECNCNKDNMCQNPKRCKNYFYFLAKHPFLILHETYAQFNELFDTFNRFYTFVISEHVHHEKKHTHKEAVRDIKRFLWMIENCQFTKKEKVILVLEIYRSLFGINSIMLDHQIYTYTTYKKIIELTKDINEIAGECNIYGLHLQSIVSTITAKLFDIITERYGMFMFLEDE